MSKMKKTLLLALALTMSATVFAACGKDKGNGGTSSSLEYSSDISSSAESESNESSESESSESSSEVESSESESSESSSEVESSESESSESSSEVESSESESSESSSEEEKQTFSVNFVGDVEGAILSQSFEYTEGEELEIVIVLDEIYTQSLKNVSVTYTVDDGEPISATLDEYDSFIVEDAVGNITVNVSGIAVNQYKVGFYNGEEEMLSVMVSHGEKLTQEQLNAAIGDVAKEGQEIWGWQEDVDGDILTETKIHAIIATGIDSAEELAAIAQNGNYFLTGDIDFSGKEMIKFDNEDNHLTGYQGTIDGRGYKITATGADINDSAILFWRLDNATIKNVTFDFSFAGLTVFRSGALCRQFVSSTLQGVTVNVSYAQIGQAAVIGTFYGGLVEDCAIYVKSPAYDTAKDGISALASSVEVGDWSAMDSTVKNLTVHLPANMEGDAVLVSDFISANNQEVTEETKQFDYIEENVIYSYDMEDAVAYTWKNSIIRPASMTVSEEEAPMDYMKVYEGVFAKKVWEDYVDYMWNYEPPFSSEGNDISYYRAIRFAIKTDETSKEIVLGSNESGELGGIGMEWSEIVMKRNARNSWNIYMDGEEKVRNVAFDDLSVIFSRKGVKNENVSDFKIYLTNVQIIAKEGAEWPDPDAPVTYFGNNLGCITKDGTETQEETPKGYENVYGIGFTTEDMLGLFVDTGITNYSVLKFKAKATTTVYLGANGGKYVAVTADWREFIVTNNNDGTFTVTVDGHGDTYTATATKVSEVFTYVMWAKQVGTLYTTELRGEEKVLVESGLAEFGETILENGLVNGVQQEETFDSVSVYKVGIDIANGGKFGVDFDISGYDEIRFDFKHTGFGGTSFIGGNSTQISVQADTWYYVSLQKIDGVWQVYMKTDPEGLFIVPYGDGGRPGDLDYANLANILSFYNWGTMQGDIYVTEIRGVASTVTPEPDPDPDPNPDEPVVTLWGTSLGSAVKSGTVADETAPDGYENVYGEAFNQADTPYLFAEIDISGYSQLKFKAKGSVGTYLGNMAGYIGLGTDWREVVLTNNNDGTFKVTVEGYGDTFTRTATTLKDMFEFTMWQSSAGTLYTTEIRGVANTVTPEPDPDPDPNPDEPVVTLWGTMLGSPLASGTTATETAPEGYEKLHSVEFTTADTMGLFANTDITNYSVLKFKAKATTTVYLGANGAKYAAVTADWREFIVTNNNDGTFTVTVDGHGDTYTATASKVSEVFLWTMWAKETGTLYVTEVRGTAKA